MEELNSSFDHQTPAEALAKSTFPPNSKSAPLLHNIPSQKLKSDATVPKTHNEETNNGNKRTSSIKFSGVSGHSIDKKSSNGNDKTEILIEMPKDKIATNKGVVDCSGNDEDCNTVDNPTEEMPAKVYKLRPRKKVNGNGREIMEDDPVRVGKEGKTEMMPRLSVTLTKEEIEEDFIEMTGGLPPRKPKRRGKSAQKNMRSAFPGRYLDAVSSGTYKFSDDS